MGPDMALELLLGLLEGGDVDGEARMAVGERDFIDLERAFVAADHGRGGAAPAPPPMPLLDIETDLGRLASRTGSAMTRS